MLLYSCRNFHLICFFLLPHFIIIHPVYYLFVGINSIVCLLCMFFLPLIRTCYSISHLYSLRILIFFKRFMTFLAAVDREVHRCSHYVCFYVRVTPLRRLLLHSCVLLLHLFLFLFSNARIAFTFIYIRFVLLPVMYLLQYNNCALESLSSFFLTVIGKPLLLFLLGLFYWLCLISYNIITAFMFLYLSFFF